MISSEEDKPERLSQTGEKENQSENQTKVGSTGKEESTACRSKSMSFGVTNVSLKLSAQHILNMWTWTNLSSAIR